MAKNKALKKLRGILEGMPCGGDLVELLDNAVARERERPEVQAAEHQARLAKAKADKTEWDLYMATDGLRVPSFVELPSESKPLEVCIAGLRFFVNKPTDTVSDGKGNTTMTAAIGVDVQSAEPVRRVFMDEFDANWGKPVAAPGVAESLVADQNAKRDERLKRAIAQQEERRILGLAEDAQDQAERIRAAEARGFYEGRNQAWRLLMETQARHPDTIKVSKVFLADLQRSILYMQKEG